MRVCLVVATILLGTIVSSPSRGADVTALLEELKKTAAPGEGITPAEDEIAKKIQAVGAPAIPGLLALLQDPNEDVRDLASDTLRDIDGLTEKDLDALIASRLKGDGWIPPAIARIGSPKAIHFLVHDLLRDPQAHTQLTWAIELLGAKAVPELIRLYDADGEWDHGLEAALAEIFESLGEKAAEGIDPLLKIACDETASTKRRVHAIAAIGTIGRAAERTVPQLMALRSHRDGDIQKAATSAILAIRPVEAAPILVQMLERDGAEPLFVLRDLAQLGTRGKAAGPKVIKYLRDEKWDVRVAAVRTLGYIGDTDAADDLISLLDDESDWRLVWSAADALGRMKIQRAESALKRVSETHWFPPVRKIAKASIQSIHGHVEEKPPAGNFSMEYFEYGETTNGMDWIEPKDLASVRFAVAADSDQLLPIRTKEYGSDLPVQWHGLTLKAGYLAGYSRGEWGGKLAFFDFKGNSQVLAAENVKFLCQMGGNFFAVTGLAHLGSNDGLILQAQEEPDGKWSAKPWRVLPAEPVFSLLLEDGRLFVSCYSGGIVLVSPDGKMQCLTRAEALK